MHRLRSFLMCSNLVQNAKVTQLPNPTKHMMKQTFSEHPPMHNVESPTPGDVRMSKVFEECTPRRHAHTANNVWPTFCFATWRSDSIPKSDSFSRNQCALSSRYLKQLNHCHIFIFRKTTNLRYQKNMSKYSLLHQLKPQQKNVCPSILITRTTSWQWWQQHTQRTSDTWTYGTWVIRSKHTWKKGTCSKWYALLEWRGVQLEHCKWQCAKSHEWRKTAGLCWDKFVWIWKAFLSDSSKGYRESTTPMLWNPRILRFDHKEEKGMEKCGRLCVKRALSSSVHIVSLPRSFDSSTPRWSSCQCQCTNTTYSAQRLGDLELHRFELISHMSLYFLLFVLFSLLSVAAPQTCVFFFFFFFVGLCDCHLHFLFCSCCPSPSLMIRILFHLLCFASSVGRHRRRVNVFVCLHLYISFYLYFSFSFHILHLCFTCSLESHRLRVWISACLRIHHSFLHLLDICKSLSPRDYS